jgi:hypothetical protein
MCIYSYENPYAEKTNDLINNGYLNVWKPASLTTLRTAQTKAVKDHNANSRKKVLGNLSPWAFKEKIGSQSPSLIPYLLTLKPTSPEQPKPKPSNTKTL